MGRVSGVTDHGYFPNRSPEVVLTCGCVVTGWPVITDLSNHGHEMLGCDAHPDGPEKWGCQRVLRPATVYEIYRFHFLGIPAPKRRSSQKPDWVNVEKRRR